MDRLGQGLLEKTPGERRFESSLYRVFVDLLINRYDSKTLVEAVDEKEEVKTVSRYRFDKAIKEEDF